MSLLRFRLDIYEQEGCIGFDLALLCAEVRTEQFSEIRELITLESSCSVKQIWQIEVGNVVTDDDIGIHLGNEISPSL